MVGAEAVEPVAPLPNKDQTQRVVKLCEDIVDGNVYLQKLNQQSLIWRGKHRRAWADEKLHQLRFTDHSPLCNLMQIVSDGR